MNTLSLGDAGEQYVAEWLKKNHFTIIARQYKQKMGEIDIIAHNKTTLVFVEVKTRSTQYFTLSEVITPAKQRKIARTAAYFLSSYKHDSYIIRFDVALINNGELTYIPNAFVPYYD